MHKKCEEILKELEKEGKLKVWWGYTFPEKEELKLRLKDMLEDEVDEKYYLSDEKIEKIKSSTFAQERLRIQEKDYCDTILARDWKDPKCIQVGKLDIKGHDCVKRVYSGEGISPTLTDMQGGNRQPKVAIIDDIYNHREPRIYDKYAPTLRSERTGLKVAINEPVIAASRGRNPDNPGSREAGLPTEQRLEINKQGISNTITTVQKDNYVIEPSLKIKEATKAGYKEAYAGDGVKISGRMKYQRGNVQKEMTQTIMASGSERGVVTPDMRIRKLTPRECWRLMGFNDEDFEKAANIPTSNTQLYKQARKFNLCTSFRKNIY